METLQDHFQEVQDQVGHWYALYIRPYRNMENKIEGAVIALVDIDELKRSFFQLEESRHYAQTVVAAMRESMVLLDRDLRVKMANPSFYETFHVSPQETEGRFFYELGNRQWDISKIREILNQVVSQGNSFKNYLVEHEFPGIGLRTMLLNCSPAHRSGADGLILLTIADFTDLKKAEESYKELAERLRHLTAQLITAQEQERQHIGKELHDDLGQLLAVLKMRLRSVHQSMATEPVQNDLESALNFVNEIIAGVRYLSQNLRPPILDLGLPKALKILFEEFSKYYGLELTLDLDDIKDLFSWETQILIYRIFQESLTNVAKHAGATEVAVSIKRRDGTVFFQLEDNGSGFDLQQVLERNDGSRGVGLGTMEERVRMLGGTLNISSQEGKGTKISFAIATGEDKLVG
jgi:two-component system CheB/CheR fusion protein